jgi:hypothetical protein
MRRWALALGLLLAWALPLRAQVPQPQELTDSVIDAAIALYNRPGTVHMSGESRVAAGSEIVGDLAALDGVLQLDGIVRGNVLVLNGNLASPAARVEGSVTMIGGTVEGAENATITAGVQVYRGSFTYRIEDGLMVRRAAP